MSYWRGESRSTKRRQRCLASGLGATASGSVRGSYGECGAAGRGAEPVRHAAGWRYVTGGATGGVGAAEAAATLVGAGAGCHGGAGADSRWRVRDVAECIDAELF